VPTSTSFLYRLQSRPAWPSSQIRKFVYEEAENLAVGEKIHDAHFSTPDLERFSELQYYPQRARSLSFTMSVSSDDSDATITQPSKQSLFPSTVGEWRELNGQYCSPFTRGRRALSTYISFRHTDGTSTHELRFKGGFDSDSESVDDGRYYVSICPVIEHEGPETKTETVLINAFCPTFSFPGNTPEEKLVDVMESMAQHYNDILGDPVACPEIASALLDAIVNPVNLDDFVSRGPGECDEDDARKERCGAEWFAYNAPDDAATPEIAEGRAQENA
jgi:hypothetical protein